MEIRSQERVTLCNHLVSTVWDQGLASRLAELKCCRNATCSGYLDSQSERRFTSKLAINMNNWKILYLFPIIMFHQLSFLLKPKGQGSTTKFCCLHTRSLNEPKPKLNIIYRQNFIIRELQQLRTKNAEMGIKIEGKNF